MDASEFLLSLHNLTCIEGNNNYLVVTAKYQSLLDQLTHRKHIIQEITFSICYFMKFSLANIKLKSVISLECAQQLILYQQIKRAAFRCTHSQLTESAIENCCQVQCILLPSSHLDLLQICSLSEN